MAARVCYGCESYSHMTLIPESARIREVRWQGVYVWAATAAFVCDQCSAMSIGERYFENTGHPGPAERAIEEGEMTVWRPLKPTTKEFPDVPDLVAAAASEAYTCHSVSAYRAACSLARAVIEATAKDNGITVNGIAAKIDAMAEKRLIRDHIKDAAHEVRPLGNELAHGDLVDPVDVTDSTLILELMSDVLDEVYQSPARVSRARAARAARKQGQAAG